MKKLHLLTLAAIASLTANAYAADIVVKSAPIQPYIITSSSIVEKDGLGHCLRSTNYSTDLAKSVLTTNGQPVGVVCGDVQASAPVAPVVAPAAPAVVPAPAPAIVPAAQKVNLPSDALFAFDKAELSETGKANLTTFADNAKQLKSLEVIIAVGHADRLGSPAYNQKLSEKRAASVKDFLIAQGIPANKVYTEGKGKTQPVTGTTCDKFGKAKSKKLIDCLAPDRRVELEAVGTK